MNNDTVINANPIERILISLIESGTYNVLLADNLEKRCDFKLILEAMRMYLFYINDDICIRVSNRLKDDEFIDTLIDTYGLRRYLEYIDLEDEDIMLSYCLGCDVIIGIGQLDEEIKIAHKLYLPFISVQSENEDVNIEKGVVNVGKNAEHLCSALILIREDKNHEVLTGHKMILEETTK